ncbi:MAG: GWxTD domain-containing protein [Acidobacteriota bacterium]
MSHRRQTDHLHRSRAPGLLALACGLIATAVAVPALASTPQGAASRRAASATQDGAEPSDSERKKQERRQAREKGRWIEEPTKAWRAGPVRYLLTRTEDKAYKRLRSEQERSAFIERFWQRRDPTPRTPFNEFRAQFHSRVIAASQKFKDSPIPGWKTDRGKIYVLLGPPDDVISDTMAREHRGTILWTYRNRFRDDLDPEVVVAFARDTTGEFIMTVRPTDVANPNRGLPFPHTPNFGYEKWLFGIDPRNNPLSPRFQQPGSVDPLLRSRGVFGGSSDLSLLGDLTKLQLPTYEVLNEHVVTRTFFGRLPLKVRVDYFKATQDRTFLTLSLGTRSSVLRFRSTAQGAQAPAVTITTRITSDEDEEISFTLESPQHFAPSPGNTSARYDQNLIWQARVALEPGIYKASFSLEDRLGGLIGTYGTNLEVPDFYGSDLQMSSVILSKGLEAAPEGSVSGRTPYVFGRWRLVPKLDPEMAPTEEAAFYFQLYNARRDPVTGLPSLDISYRFYVLREDRFVPVSEPILLRDQHTQVHAYAVPLEPLPAGSYMVRIEAHDRLAGTMTFREVLLQVTGEKP